MKFYKNMLNFATYSKITIKNNIKIIKIPNFFAQAQ